MHSQNLPQDPGTSPNILENYKHLKLGDNPNNVLVLPPHYAQLAAALGLNTQHLLPTDPVSTRTDFERLIELNRAQAASIKCEMDVPMVELKSETISSSVNGLEDEQNQNNQNLLNQPIPLIPPQQHLHHQPLNEDNGQPPAGCDDNMWRPW